MSKLYKGFDPELKCRGFQFEVGKSYEEPEAKLCKKGFHACENPLDVFGYYAPADSRYCEVELEDDTGESSDDSKRCGKRIHIGAEIGLEGIVKAGVKFIFDKVDWKNAKESNTGDWSVATNTGYRSAATNTGNQSTATNTGDQSAATNTGDRSAAIAKGKESIAIVTGYQGKAKGEKGCWLVLTERDEDMHVLGVKAVCVDDEDIKSDTFYMLIDGEVVEADACE